jgi:trans-aconitate 2-methyltransferase
MGQDTWNPEQYERFQEQRSLPFFDLLSLVRPRARMRVLDLGCGTGELTAHLHRHLKAQETLGIDSSESMLLKSKAHAGEGLRFGKAEILHFAKERGEEGPWDLIFSNAALHWVPEQEELLALLTRALAPEGQLAVQVPANHDHPGHTLAAQLAGESPFKEALQGYQRCSPVLPPEEYARILDRLAYPEQHVRLVAYAHRLGSREEVVEWMKGTLLTDYERRLTPELFSLFLGRYRTRLLSVLADTRPHFFPFKRILLWAGR